MSGVNDDARQTPVMPSDSEKDALQSSLRDLIPMIEQSTEIDQATANGLKAAELLVQTGRFDWDSMSGLITKPLFAAAKHSNDKALNKAMGSVIKAFLNLGQEN